MLSYVFFNTKQNLGDLVWRELEEQDVAKLWLLMVFIDKLWAYLSQASDFKTAGIYSQKYIL